MLEINKNAKYEKFTEEEMNCLRVCDTKLFMFHGKIINCHDGKPVSYEAEKDIKKARHV